MKSCVGSGLRARATDIYISVMLLVFPLFTGFKGYGKITEAKLCFFLVLTGLWLLALLAGEFFDKGERGLPLTTEGKLILVYLAVCFLSAAVSPFSLKETVLGAGRFDGLLHICLCSAIFFGVSRWGRPRGRYALLLCLSISLCCVLAVAQLLGLNPLGLFPSDCTYYSKGLLYTGEFLGTIGNGNLFSAFLCLCLPLFSCLYICGRLKGIPALPAIFLGAFCIFECTVSAGKLALFLCLLILPPVVVTSAERLGRLFRALAVFALALWLSLCFSGEPAGARAVLSFEPGVFFPVLPAGAAILLGLSFLRVKTRLKPAMLRTGLALFSLLLLAAALAFAYGSGSQEGTVYELSRVLHGEVDDSFGSSRIRIWRKTLSLASERPILGGGPGTISQRLNIEFSRYAQETGRLFHARVDNAHNVYLGILADCGAIALLSYLAAIAVTLIKAVRSAGKSSAALSICCSLLSYWVQDFFGLGLFIVTPIVWMLWGLASSDMRPKPLPVEEKEAEAQP